MTTFRIRGYRIDMSYWRHGIELTTGGKIRKIVHFPLDWKPMIWYGLALWREYLVSNNRKGKEERIEDARKSV